MITIEKQVKIIIDGDDVRTLSHLANLACTRIRESCSGGRDDFGKCVDGLMGKEIHKVEELARRIFDA